MNGRAEASLSECKYLAEVDLACRGHEITWDIVGKKLAHGHCIHCNEPVVVAKEKRMFLKTGAPFRQACPADHTADIQ